MFGIEELREKIAKLQHNEWINEKKIGQLEKDSAILRADLDRLVGLMGYQFVDVEAHRELVKLPERSEE